ncbi:enoyl-CoA hydratase [Vreelandella zhaodongensis]|uniref:enoyl-CoA hydratase n=1 Tax=Vreelandella zhaodongensis TaxID=1176240 RepID=UPI003EBDEEA8
MNHTNAAQDILLRKDQDGVVYLTLNRPDKFNTLSETMLTALQSELETIACDAAVRCVVVAANGRGFCAGHDLKEMHSNPDKAYYQALFSRCSRVMLGLVELPVPVIAKVHGMATAAGCQLVASCDLAIASRSASFAVSGINAGLFCSTPAVALSRCVSPKRAFSMLVSGDFIDADTALDWGLVSDVCEAIELDAAVDKQVAKILSKSPAAVRYGKSMFHAQRQMSMADAYDYAGSIMADNMMHADAQEGVDAFLNKRQPVWQAPGH